jgi:hypothetical protein
MLKKSSPLKLLGQMEPNLAGSIYVRSWTTDAKWWQYLTWPFGSGELKKYNHAMTWWKFQHNILNKCGMPYIWNTQTLFILIFWHNLHNLLFLFMFYHLPHSIGSFWLLVRSLKKSNKYLWSRISNKKISNSNESLKHL